MALRRSFATVLVVLALVAVASLPAQDGTRGVGVYPGDPQQDFGPLLVPGGPEQRNLALRRAASASSSYDDNLTAQLVTDGIRQTRLPRWLATATSEQGAAGRVARELLVDDNLVSTVTLERPPAWLQLELGGGDAPLEIDRIELHATLRRHPLAARLAAQRPEGASGQWTCIVRGSDDGRTWQELGRAAGPLPDSFEPPKDAGFAAWWWPGPAVTPSVTLTPAAHSRFYRIAVEPAGLLTWTVSELKLFDRDKRVEVGGPYRFDSAWMSAGSGTEWVSVDLGARARIERVALAWIRRAAEGSVQVSDDARSWRDVAPLPATSGLDDEIRLAQAVEARYVRVLMKRPASPEGYILSELEVYGTGGVVPRPKPAPAVRADGRLDLAGGGWRLQRDSLVSADGPALATVGFADADWLVATVPGTVLSSYWNAGAVPDPNFGDNQLAISDSFFYADFWYRTEFVAPQLPPGRRAFLNLDGVNWKAEIFLNGEPLGRVEGAFMRGRFDVTGRLRPGAANALAVRVLKNATPGSAKQKTLESAGLNGGALGADNPTYHASIGWDWIPTVRGRDTGIWNDVYLTASGPVTIGDPLLRTTLPLPDTSSADVRIEVPLRNHETAPVAGTLRGRFGEISFEQPVVLPAAGAQTLVLDPSTHPVLRLAQPRLWWPNGYGEPSLYDVELRFDVNGTASDLKTLRTGVRQFTYSEEGGVLRIWINGRRFVGRGGNWGFPEAYLRYRGREYDAAVRYHRDLNFTMIRNWVGQTGDDEFYEACDKYGIVVWQDFWLANPADGPDPSDDALFMSNARDTLLRIRNHPSLGLYCGRNEGYPPKTLDAGLRAAISELQPDIHYIPNSAWDGVSGGGPYGVQPTRYYFEQRATPKLHSELGMPNIPTLDSVRQMMPESALWPQGLVWGLHDFNLDSAQRLSAFQSVIDRSYGGASDLAEWVSLAQLVDYEGYRAIFEAQSKNRMGVLLWMSHPSWPSFVWQTYDYYFDTPAGYYGSRKGAEPLHIQWNPLTDAVEVVNLSAGSLTGLLARAEILNLDGSLRWSKTATLDSREDSVETPLKLEYPAGLTPVHFLRLRLSRGGETVSDNFYWRGSEEGNYRALRTLPKVTLRAVTQVERAGSGWLLTTELRNETAQPALLVRVGVVRSRSGDRILPALHSDNYVSLMPGERRTITSEVEVADARGETPRVTVDGYNVVPWP
jgi:hypothetical protein